MDLPRRDTESVSFTAPLLVWRTEQYGDIGCVTIAGAAAEAIGAHELMRRLELGRRRGFGSVRVEAAVGASRWATSVFPQKGGGWFLPVRKAFCRAEDTAAGDAVALELGLRQGRPGDQPPAGSRPQPSTKPFQRARSAEAIGTAIV